MITGREKGAASVRGQRPSAAKTRAFHILNPSIDLRRPKDPNFGIFLCSVFLCFFHNQVAKSLCHQRDFPLHNKTLNAILERNTTPLSIVFVVPRNTFVFGLPPCISNSYKKAMLPPPISLNFSIQHLRSFRSVSDPINQPLSPANSSAFCFSGKSNLHQTPSPWTA